MTEAQRKTKFGSFLSAGYAAFRAAAFFPGTGKVVVIDNPYREQPFRDLWFKGWRDAEREHKRGIPFRSVGYTDDRTFDDRRQKFFKPKFTPKHKQTKDFKSQVGRGEAKIVFNKPVDKEGSLNLNRLNNRINNKFRTKV